MIKGLSTHIFVNQRLSGAMLDRIAKTGVDVIEIFCARQHFDYQDRSQVRDLAAWFSGAEIKLNSIHAPMYRDTSWGHSGPQAVVSITETEKIRRIEAVDEIKRALDLADYVPFRYMVTHMGVSNQEFDDRRWDAAFSSIEHLRMFARQRGVDLVLENIPNELSTPDRLLGFVRYTHLNDMGFCFDTGHAHLGEGVQVCFEKMRDRVRTTHVHDNLGEKDEHLFPYEGSIDWKRTLEDFGSALQKHDFPIVLEIREFPEMKDPLERAVDVFRKFENAPSAG